MFFQTSVNAHFKFNLISCPLSLSNEVYSNYISHVIFFSNVIFRLIDILSDPEDGVRNYNNLYTLQADSNVSDGNGSERICYKPVILLLTLNSIN